MNKNHTFRRHFSFFAWIALASMLFAAACNKDEDPSSTPIIPFECHPPTHFSDMIECHRQNGRSNEEVQFRLQGKWDWKFRVDYYTTTIDSSDAIFEGLYLEFINDFQVAVHSSRIDTVICIISNEGERIWAPLDSIYQLDGDLALCKSELMITHSSPSGIHRNWFCKDE